MNYSDLVKCINFQVDLEKSNSHNSACTSYKSFNRGFARQDLIKWHKFVCGKEICSDDLIVQMAGFFIMQTSPPQLPRVIISDYLSLELIRSYQNINCIGNLFFYGIDPDGIPNNTNNNVKDFGEIAYANSATRFVFLLLNKISEPSQYITKALESHYLKYSRLLVIVRENDLATSVIDCMIGGAGRRYRSHKLVLFEETLISTIVEPENL